MSEPKRTSHATVETLGADSMLPTKQAFALSVAEELKPILAELGIHGPLPFRSIGGCLTRLSDTPFK